MKLRYKIINGCLAILIMAIFALAITISYTDDCPPTPVVAADTETMKAVVSHCYGGPDSIRYIDVEKPKPGPQDVIVRIEAADMSGGSQRHVVPVQAFVRGKV